MAEHITQAECLLTYLKSVQPLTVAAPPRAAGHPTTALLEDYAANVFPVEVGLKWSLEPIRHAIGKGPHSSTLSLDSTAFFRKEILERTQQVFSIVILVTKAISLLGTDLRISSPALVDQVNLNMCLIYNSSEEPDTSTPLVNTFTDKCTAPRQCNLALGLPISYNKYGTPTRWMSPSVFPNGMYRTPSSGATCTRPMLASSLKLSPPLPIDTSALLCINMVLTMSWVNSPNFSVPHMRGLPIVPTATPWTLPPHLWSMFTV